MTLPPSPGEIVMIPASPGGVIGPGLRLDLNAGVPSPLPSSALWDVEILSGEPAVRVWSSQIHSQANPLRFTPWITDRPVALPLEGIGVVNGTSVQVSVNLQLQGGGPADATGTTNFTWDTTAGLPALSTQAGQGLTPVQATQLEETHASSFPSILIDELTLVTLNPIPSNGPINAQLPNPCFGVIVRIANVPPELQPTTPDGDYWFPSLAICRIFRGADLWKRVPIHTSSKLVELLDESIVAGLTAVTATQWLLNLSVQVTFREGVTGTVHLMLLP